MIDDDGDEGERGGAARVAAVAATCWAFAAFVTWRSGAFAVPAWIAAVAALVAGGVAVLVAAGRAGPAGAALAADERRFEVTLVGAPFALALALTSGALHSPAVVLVALVVLVAGWGRPRLGVGLALAALALLWLRMPRESVIDGWVHGPLLGPAGQLASVVRAAALLAGIGVVPSWLAARSSAVVGAAERRAAGYASFFGARPTPEAGVSPTALRHDSARVLADTAEQRRQVMIVGQLQDIADLHGATMAVLWRRPPGRDVFEALAWSGPDSTPPALRPEWLDLLTYAAGERLPMLHPADDRPQVIVVPVSADGEVVLGVLSLHAPSGLKSPKARLLAWLPRHALQLGRTAVLLDEAYEVGIESVRSTALLQAAEQFQAVREEGPLGEAICRTALQVTAGTRAALVWWSPADKAGVVKSSIGTDAVPVGTPVAVASLVGDHCEKGMPQIWENARFAVASSPVFVDGEPRRAIGSLGVWVLRSREGAVQGAIVIEGDLPSSVLIRDMRNVKLLSTYTSMALETVWEIKSVLERSRTDQLTGLYNRRYFEEKLAQVRVEFERHHQPCALIVADVDHFKKVNDVHGHDAGDAVLRAVAEIFRDNVRAVDVCARMGGEEIAVLLPTTELSGALESAERLRAALERRVIRHAAKELRVTASFGVACFPANGNAWDAVFKAADRALYEAKHGGRNQVRFAATTVDRAKV